MRTDAWQRNLVALFIAQTMSMVAFSFVFPFFPLYIQSLGITDVAAAVQWAGAAVAASAISMAVVQPIWGSMADRHGRKPMVLRSIVGGAVLIGLMGLVTNVEQLVVLRFIQGAVTGTVAAANALAASSSPKARLGFTLGLLQVGLFVGTSVGPLIGGIVADGWGFRVPFYVAAVLMVLSAVIVVVFVHEDFVRPPADAHRAGPFQEIRSLLGLVSLPILVTVIFLIQLGNTVISPVLSLFVADLNGIENAATAAGIVLAVTGVASAGAALVLGRLGDRIGHSLILKVCLLGAAVTYFPQAMVQQVWQLVVLRMLLGVAFGGLMPSANALLANRVPRPRRGAAFGLTATATAMANAVGPLSGAAMAANLGMRSIFVGAGVLYVLSFGWALFGLRTPGPAPARTVDAVPVREVGPAEVTAQPEPNDAPLKR